MVREKGMVEMVRMFQCIAINDVAYCQEIL